jgi:glycosyltransferase involved in cell wall biosynthesis
MSGDSIRYYNLIMQLPQRGWDVSIFSLCRPEMLNDASLCPLRAACKEIVTHPFRVSALARYAQFAEDSIRRQPFHNHFSWSREAQAAFDHAFDPREFDLLFVHQIHMQRYVAGKGGGAVVLDTHNAEYLRLKSMIDGDPRSPRAMYARTQLDPVRSLEQRTVRDVDCTLAVSSEELAYFQTLGARRTELVPNGVDLAMHQPKSVVSPEPRILFLASLGYSANLDALHYLVDDILPHCRRTDAQLDIIGSNPPVSLPEVSRRSPILAAPVGEVADVRPYVERNRLLVVPLRYGGGTRLKIIEGLAQGIPIISTSIGCAGLGLKHLEDIIVANEPEEFAAWIDRLLEDTDLCQRLAKQGRRKVEQEFSWSRIADGLHSILQSTVADRV